MLYSVKELVLLNIYLELLANRYAWVSFCAYAHSGAMFSSRGRYPLAHHFESEALQYLAHRT